MTAADSENSFAVDLYRALHERPGNLAVAPASVELALTLAFAGARGATADEMARALRVRARDEAPARARMLMNLLGDRSLTGITLRAANRLFVERSYALDVEYVESMAGLGAPLEAVDFRTAPDRSRRRINGWVAEQTADRIRDLVPPDAVDTETRLASANAVYLLADWRSPFRKEATRPAAFHLSTDARANVPTLHQVKSFPFRAIDGVKVLEMPYVGNELSMVIVLPDRLDGLPQVESCVDAARLAEWIEGLREERVSVWLPKFTINPTDALALADPLRELGVALAFDRERADFTGIANPPDPADRLYVSEIFHKAFVEVDEKGTEAAASNAGVFTRFGASLAPEQLPKEFKADHPFMFVIRDRKSRSFLFLGRVVDPVAVP